MMAFRGNFTEKELIEMRQLGNDFARAIAASKTNHFELLKMIDDESPSVREIVAKRINKYGLEMMLEIERDEHLIGVIYRRIIYYRNRR